MDKKKQVIELLEKYGNETDMFKAFITQDEFSDLADEIVKLFAIPDVSGSLPIEELRSKFLSMRFSKGEIKNCKDDYKAAEMYGFTECINTMLEWLQPKRK